MPKKIATCKGCGCKLRFEVKSANPKVKCPKCGKVFAVHVTPGKPQQISWQIKANGKVHGPFSDAQMAEFTAGGRLTLQTLVRHKEHSADRWEQAGAVPCLAKLFNQLKEAPPAVTPQPRRPYTCEIDDSGGLHATWESVEAALELLEILDDYWDESKLAMRSLKEQSRQADQQYKRNNRSSRGSMYGLARGTGAGQALRWLQFIGQTASGMQYAAASGPVEEQISYLTNLQINIEHLEIQVRRWIRSNGGKPPRKRSRK